MIIGRLLESLMECGVDGRGRRLVAREGNDKVNGGRTVTDKDHGWPIFV